MKNLNIYKIVFFFVIYGCKTHTYTNEKVNPNNDGTRTIEWDLKKNLKEKKTGIYLYPNLGTKFSLKKGKFNGTFQIIDIDKNDTIFYCNYVDNLPIGRYVKNFYHRYKYRHFRTLPLKPNIDFGDGKGFFNNQHQKEGIWIEDFGNCTKKGGYEKGKKEGVWEENCYSDTGGDDTKKIFIYKNDSIVNTEIKIFPIGKVFFSSQRSEMRFGRF
ncbi:hypothetical protein ACM39_18580 [Chryseobacterium sp. FH2]|uniref:hypothetical protein n=1 Tax=Chryseobacterium sp. FH2 TaxID=1674291 RepID=UPI00065AE564|nr:hypothetical protein [Chryseobacterium sp. FH2]KMQ58540.1 hypothetical protein ACM39_18580 [Chryseobacterium sp. FH2]